MLDNKMSRKELALRTNVATFHQWLGLKLTGIERYGIELIVRWWGQFAVNKDLQYNNGGILAKLIDNAVDYASTAELQPFYLLSLFASIITDQLSKSTYLLSCGNNMTE